MASVLQMKTRNMVASIILVSGNICFNLDQEKRVYKCNCAKSLPGRSRSHGVNDWMEASDYRLVGSLRLSEHVECTLNRLSIFQHGACFDRSCLCASRGSRLQQVVRSSRAALSSKLSTSKCDVIRFLMKNYTHGTMPIMRLPRQPLVHVCVLLCSYTDLNRTHPQ